MFSFICFKNNGLKIREFLDVQIPPQYRSIKEVINNKPKDKNLKKNLYDFDFKSYYGSNLTSYYNNLLSIFMPIV